MTLQRRTTRRTGRTRADGAPAPVGGDLASLLEHEGDIAADYLEGLLDIADLDGDIDMDVEGDRAAGLDRRRRPDAAWSAATAWCWTRCRS